MQKIDINHPETNLKLSLKGELNRFRNFWNLKLQIKWVQYCMPHGYRNLRTKIDDWSVNIIFVNLTDIYTYPGYREVSVLEKGCLIKIPSSLIIICICYVVLRCNNMCIISNCTTNLRRDFCMQKFWPQCPVVALLQGSIFTTLRDRTMGDKFMYSTLMINKVTVFAYIKIIGWKV